MNTNNTKNLMFSKHHNRNKYVLFSILFLSLLLPSSSWAGKTMIMYLGEVKVMDIKNVERVAIGNPKVISNSILYPGQLVVLANSVGATTLHIWMEDDTEVGYDILVKEKTVMDSYSELRQLLQSIPGVSAKKVGQLTVVTGQIEARYKEIFDRIIAQFKGVLNLVTPKDPYNEISSLLSTIPHIKIKKIGENVVVTGEVNAEYAKLLQLVSSKFPKILDMTRTQEEIAGKMIYMQVRIMEMNKSFTETLGIQWGDTTFNLLGPSFEFGVESTRNGATILNADNTSSALTSVTSATLQSGTGYFGIATGITSLINLAENTGDAILLAEPRLSTRSGGKAEFLSGGEYPMPTTSTTGQTTVDFKKYGIQLNIEPTVDDLGNILAHIETEISTIDTSVSVDGIPGLKSRSTKTDISIRDNQTLVIAGLLNEYAGNTFDGIKWLNNLPILGPLFRSENFQNQRTEMVIFVTPRIYDATSPINVMALEKAAQIDSQFSEIVKGNELLD